MPLRTISPCRPTRTRTLRTLGPEAHGSGSGNHRSERGVVPSMVALPPPGLAYACMVSSITAMLLPSRGRITHSSLDGEPGTPVCAIAP
jgi:hypothetical protein